MNNPDRKIKLNEISHSVRASQAILQYGVGAMVDFPNETLMTASPKFWRGGRRIFDERFAKALDVDYFCLPRGKIENASDEPLPYVHFPEWYFCPRCRKFQSIKKWVAGMKKKNDMWRNETIAEYNRRITLKMKCPDCNQYLVVSRIITVCPDGHISDFPWTEWAHRFKGGVCEKPSISFKTGPSGTEGLEGVTVSCSTCDASSTLQDAFNKDIFKIMDEKNGGNNFVCKGRHPQNHDRESCSLYPKTMQRGSSSVYFPLVYSSLVIPPYADIINKKIENSRKFETCLAVIEDEPPETRDEKIRERLPGWAENISNEIDMPFDSVEEILRRKWLDKKNRFSVHDIQYRAEEYEALNGEISIRSEEIPGDFSRESIYIEKYGKLPYIKSISLIDKIRVVNALVGFSRINPVTHMDDDGFVPIRESDARWYPAYEVRGEGIFIEFDEKGINDWIEKNPSVQNRVKYIIDRYPQSTVGKNHPRNITPKFILLHTLSHLLIKQLSFECGYNVASLSERIYCGERSEGKQMAGIFIYTANGDSEGTLGGLVRQGRPDTFPNIFNKAIKSAYTCSNDPVCILSRGQGRDSLNMAACHACALLPETCCEEHNSLLDRGLIVGTFEDRTIGLFKNEFL